MKRLIILLSITVFAASLMYPFEYKGLEYEVISDSKATCRLLGYDNISDVAEEGKLTLPARVEHGKNVYSVISIGKNGLANVAVNEIVLPETLVELEESSLAGTTASIIHLPASIHIISDYALQNNESLQNVVIPSHAEQLGKGIFRGCSSLKNVIIEAAINSIPDFTFADCYSLKSFDCAGLIVSVGERAFEGCSQLAEFNFSGLEIMGERAFSGCSSFTDIRITSRLENIPTGAFEHCNSLHTFVAGKNILNIGREAFGSCTSLSQIEIGSSIENIDSRAFAGCKSLKKIYSLNEVPPLLHYDSFDDIVFKSASLLVRTADRDRYLYSPVWMDFKNVVACEYFPLQVESIVCEENTLLCRMIGGELIIRSDYFTIVCSSAGKLIYSGTPAEEVEIKLSESENIVYIFNGREHRALMVR